MIGRITVSLDAVRRNAAALQAFVSPAKIGFVVKSNAYGHGLVEISRTVQSRAERLCVFALDEALALRESGITRPIFIMGPVPPERLTEIAEGNFEIALWNSGSYLDALIATARRSRTRIAAHVKVDTGVARLGLAHASAASAIAAYARVPELQVTGIFSHLAAAEELDSPFTEVQLERFTGVLSSAEPALQARRINPTRHIAASAAAMLWPKTRLDMVRVGIALYGLWPSPETRAALSGSGLTLEPALSYVSTIADVRDVEAGAPIGYGCSYRAPRKMRIGIVPAGYADGIPRALSNCGAFAVRGAPTPIVGRVCMNMTLIDLASAPEARPGDTVTLIGSDGAAAVSAEDWARWSQSIAYEIVARIPAELPRTYTATAAAVTGLSARS